MNQDESSPDLESKPPTLLIGLNLILPDTATGPAIESGCALFFRHPEAGRCFVELSAAESQELVRWLTGHHPNIQKPDDVLLN